MSLGMGIAPEWERITVGPGCVVYRSDFVTVAGDSKDDGWNTGRIFFYSKCGNKSEHVEIVTAPNFGKGGNNKGKRSDWLTRSDESGDPVPEIMLLMALLSKDFGDRVTALYRFMRDRRIIFDQILERMKIVLPAYEALSEFPFPGPPDDEEQPPLVLSDEIPYRHFVGEFVLIMTESMRLKELHAWQTSALRIVNARNEIRCKIKYPTHARVLESIKDAALEHAGVPYFRKVQEFVNIDLKRAGMNEYSETTIRGALKTLGFRWIPGKKDWENHWNLETPRGASRSET